MKLALKKSPTHWVKLDKDEAEFYLSPISVSQYEMIDTFQYDESLSDYGKVLKAARYYIKYAIKDWKKLLDDDGNEIKCVIKNDELEDELWWALVNSEASVLELYMLVLKEVGWTENDKKKLSFLQSWIEKVNSLGEEKTTQ